LPKKSVNEAALVIDSIGSKMTKVSEEELVVTKPTKKPTNFQNGGAQSPPAASRLATSCGETSSSSSGSDSDNAVKTASESSCSSVASSTASMASSGTTTKLAARMADKVNLGISSPAEKRFKFEPNEDFLNQLLAMGISLNGAKKALYYTGNRSVALATNWIFDHPELDLETPLEEEMRRLEAEEEEAFDEDDEDEDSEEERLMQHHHHQQMLQQQRRVQQQSRIQHHQHHYCHEDEEDLEEEEELCQQSRSTKINSHNGEVYTIEDSDDDTETDSDDFDEEDIPEFKMVFVVNMSLEMGPGKIAAQVGHAALGVQRVLSSKAKSGKYKLSTTDLGLWQDFGENMVVVQGETTQHLKDLHLMAEDLELPSFLVKDAGITQVPSGAVTVFGVFGEDEDVNKITGRLKHL